MNQNNLYGYSNMSNSNNNARLNVLNNLREIITGYNNVYSFYNLNLTEYNRNMTSIIRLLDNNKCLVSAINMAKKHTKPNPNAGIEGGIIEKEMPIELSNIMLFNPVTKKQDRVGFKKLESGKKVRIYKSNREVIDI